MSEKIWNGTLEELKTKVEESIQEDNQPDFENLEGIGQMSCKMEKIGSCTRNGKQGDTIRYTCTDSSGNKTSFSVCDIKHDDAYP